MPITTVIVDIEGTTTSISFVKEVLFPFIRNNIRSHLEINWDQKEVQDDVELLRKQANEDLQNGLKSTPQIENTDADKETVIDSAIKNVIWQMDQDRKINALKQLQGHMWRSGYEKELIKGHVYDDVPEALKLWTSSGKKVYVYSSGSTEAQQLLFGYSIFGNLLQYFSGHFDTNIGLKGNSASYRQISTAIGIQPENILFLTDIPIEAVAATEAGMQAFLMSRPGNAPLTQEMKERFPVYDDFGQLNV